VVVATAEERGPGRRAERGGVKAVELEAIGREPLGCGRLAGTAERAGGAEARVVDQNDQDVGRTAGGRSGSIGGNFASGSFASRGRVPS
jgi:hypothetical protein